MTASTDVPLYAGPDLTSDPEALRRVSRHLALDHDVLALGWDGDELAVAIPETAGSETVDRIRYETGARVRAIVAPRELIRSRLSSAYPTISAPLATERDDESPVVTLLDSIFEDAVLRRASDIHFEPTPDGGRIRQRVDGTMRSPRPLPRETYDRLVARIKLLAGMDIADRRQPQDGRCTFDVAGSRTDARVATLPASGGEKVVIRLLAAGTLVGRLDALGMPPETLHRYRRAIRGASGCVVVAGPTGSGKTTTLYASLADRNHSDLNICTIEDPVEVIFAGLTQVQVNPRAGLTFASALRAIVRQDPDLVMIGEVRDEETAHAAAGAALAGHLVLTSIHAGEAKGALERLVEFGISRRTIAGAVRGVVSQRLVRRTLPSGGYGGRTGLFEYAEVDSTGRLEADGGVSLEQSMRDLISRGETDAREGERVLGPFVA